ncbi:MAG: OmpA family protein [Niabella sp.]
MSINIVDLVKNYVSPDLISKAGSFLGESEGGISKAVSGLIPSILGGIVSKGSSSEADSQQLLNAAKEANDSGLLGNLSSLLGNNDLLSKGSGWFNSLFGGQSNTIIDTISNFAGIKSSSSSSLIGMVTPLIMALLGKKAQDDNLSASGFSSFLSSQKSSVLSALPTGLGSIATALGLGSLGNAAAKTVEEVKATAASAYNYAEEQAKKSGSGVKWLMPLLLLAILVFLLWWLLSKKGCNQETVAPIADTTAVVTKSAKGTLDSLGNYIYDVGNNKEIKLADGTVLTVGENSTEVKLYNMLSDAAFVVDTVDKSANWIVLDRVYFETGKSVLTATSAAQVKNIAAILKNFPNAAIKLGGYTDNTGDAAVNKKVSLERAKVVSGELTKAGAAEKQVVEAVGYGPEFPVCPKNDTPECKAQNRRVDIKVAVK